MVYRLEISEKAREQLRELPRDQRRLIGQRIETLRHGLQGDIKKLTTTKIATGCAQGIIACSSCWKTTRSPSTVLKIEKKPMSKTTAASIARRRTPRPTMSLLKKRIDRLQERLEDLEDLRELERAIAENGSRPLVPWAKAKKELGLG